MPPTDGGAGPKGGGKRRRRGSSSIRAAAETAAGSAADAPRKAPPDEAPLRRRSGTRRRRSRTSEATRRAAAEALQPHTPGPEAPREPGAEAPRELETVGTTFPDYEARSDSWDPWEAEVDPPGRVDPDFDAQRTLGEWLEGVIPPDAQVHFVNAGREFAQGVQVTVDHHTGKRRGADGGPAGPSRIEIE